MVLIYANPWCDLSHWSVVSQSVHLYLWSWKKDVFSGVIVALLSWFYPAVAADDDSCECILVSITVGVSPRLPRLVLSSSHCRC